MVEKQLATVRTQTCAWITFSVFTQVYSGYDDHNASRGLKALRCSNIPFMLFPARSPRVRHRNELTERDWEDAAQGVKATSLATLTSPPIQIKT